MAKKRRRKAKNSSKHKAAGNGYRNGHIADELNKLANAVERALKATVGSKHLSGVQNDVKNSVRKISTRLQNAIQDARKSEEARRLQSQARKVYAVGRKQARVSANRLRSNLSKGIKTLAGELARLADKVGKS